MELSTLIGWVLVLGATAIIFRKRLPVFSSAQRAPAAPFVATEEGRHASGEERCWCDAIERLGDSKAFLFDEGLCLIAAGACASEDIGESAHPRHLIDIVPPDESALFLRGGASALQGEGSSWECHWQGRRAVVRAVAVAQQKILICIRNSSP